MRSVGLAEHRDKPARYGQDYCSVRTNVQEFKRGDGHGCSAGYARPSTFDQLAGFEAPAARPEGGAVTTCQRRRSEHAAEEPLKALASAPNHWARFEIERTFVPSAFASDQPVARRSLRGRSAASRVTCERRPQNMVARITSLHAGEVPSADELERGRDTFASEKPSTFAWERMALF